VFSLPNRSIIIKNIAVKSFLIIKDVRRLSLCVRIEKMNRSDDRRTLVNKINSKTTLNLPIRLNNKRKDSNF
jgi:hypothetical protein